jgi:hypothetical protein
MTTLLRWALSIALLVVVWRHSHWSVALCLSLNVLFAEGIVALLKKKGVL